ncbi:MAG: alpha-ketoglutarate-dependent dioxygenase AlkB [Pseudomonadota bacterium]
MTRTTLKWADKTLVTRAEGICYVENFMSRTVADEWLDLFRTNLLDSWQSEKFSIFGKEVRAPRTLCWFGEKGLNYRYAGNNHCAQGWPQFCKPLLRSVEHATRMRFNFLLVNRYLDGKQYMGWHKDDEKGASPRIASLSLGASRRFLIETSAGRQEQTLGHGSLLIFDGRMRHQLPKSTRIDQERLNLTFRYVEPSI